MTTTTIIEMTTRQTDEPIDPGTVYWTRPDGQGEQYPYPGGMTDEEIYTDMEDRETGDPLWIREGRIDRAQRGED